MAIVEKFICKDFDDEKIILELQECAKSGDQIILKKDKLTEFECIGSWIEDVVAQKHKSDIEKLKKEYRERIEEQINNAKIQQQSETEKEYNAKIAEKDKALHEATTKLTTASEQYKTSPEYLKILSELTTSKENLKTSLESQANQLNIGYLKVLSDKDKEINDYKIQLSKSHEEFKNGEEYKNLKKHLDEANASLANINKQHEMVIESMNKQAVLQKEQHALDVEKAKTALKKTLLENADKEKQAAIKHAQDSTKEVQQKMFDDLTKLQHEKIESQREAITQLNKEIQNYKDRRSSDRNMKKIGNELEQWCKDAIDNEFQDDDFVKLGQVNTSITREKPDIVVNFLNKSGEVYKKATIECKTQSLDGSAQYKKNDSFIDKLMKDSKTNKSELAILVTELETHDEFTFRKHKNSSSDLTVFMCRPDCLVTILRLYNMFYKKEAEIADLEGTENKYKNQISEKFMVYFNDFQAKIEKATKSLLKHSETVNKHLNTVVQSSEKAQETFNSQIKNKINALLVIFEKWNPKFDSQFQKLLNSEIDLLISSEIPEINKGDLN